MNFDPTVAENLDIPLSCRNVPKSERQGMVADILDRFGIVAKKDLYPAQLSGGQQQLVAVAQGSSFLATLGWQTQSLWDCASQLNGTPNP